MKSQRLNEALHDIEEIEEQTDIELEELGDAIHEVEDLQHKHKEEIQKDEEFIQDLKDLYQEIRMVKKIERHMYNIIEAYGGGELNRNAFKERYVKDQERLSEVIHEIRTELEEIIKLISEEERLTNKDLDIEGAVEELVRALNKEQSRLEGTQEHMNEMITGGE